MRRLRLGVVRKLGVMAVGFKAASQEQTQRSIVFRDEKPHALCLTSLLNCRSHEQHLVSRNQTQEEIDGGNTLRSEMGIRNELSFKMGGDLENSYLGVD
jgi:hypothetical protein